MRKVIAVVMAVLMMLAFAACKAGTPYADIRIDPQTGAGEKSISMKILKNDAEGVGNNFGPGAYIPDPNKLLELFKQSVPQGFDVTMEDVVVEEAKEDGTKKDVGYYELTTTFSFSSIDDYNAKILSLITKELWDGINEENKKAAEEAGEQYVPIMPATLTEVAKDGKKTVTFTEDMRVLELAGYWAAKVCFNDTTGGWVDIGSWVQNEKGEWVLDPNVKSVANYKDLVSFDDTEYTVKMGDKEEVFAWSETNEISISDTFDYTPAPEVKPEDKDTGSNTSDNTDNGNGDTGSNNNDKDNTGDTEDSGSKGIANPPTGDIGSIAIVLVAMTSAGVAAVSRKRK